MNGNERAAFFMTRYSFYCVELDLENKLPNLQSQGLKGTYISRELCAEEAGRRGRHVAEGFWKEQQSLGLSLRPSYGAPWSQTWLDGGLFPRFNICPLP